MWSKSEISCKDNSKTQRFDEVHSWYVDLPHEYMMLVLDFIVWKETIATKFIDTTGIETSKAID